MSNGVVIDNAPKFFGAATATAGALSLNELALIIGIVVTIASFVMSWIYKARDSRSLEEQNHYMRQLLERSEEKGDE